jgi:hypothetical protein
MSAVDDVDELLKQFYLAQGEFVKGNPEPVKKLLSRREDVTLNNPFSPPAHLRFPSRSAVPRGRKDATTTNFALEGLFGR